MDDDEGILAYLKTVLDVNGYEIKACSLPEKVMGLIEDFRPDLILLDIMMQEVDGFTLLQKIKEKPEWKAVKIIILTAKSFEFDRLKAFELGADGFLRKPVKAEDLTKRVDQVLNYRAVLTFWGTRGSLPSPGPDTIKYGGNTSCLELRFPDERLFIFDAGTGIRNLGRKIAMEGDNKKMNLFFTHPHWDHLFGLPFFIPVYKPGNEVAIYGTSHGNISLREAVAGQMEGIYFPITIKEFGARVYFKEISEGEYDIDGIKIQTHFLNHPGHTIGYRVWWGDKSIAYITDNELPEKSNPNFDSHTREKMVAFLKGVDFLIHDSSYTDEEYKIRVGWGHPPLSELISLAMDAEVKHLKLFHHEPDHTDEDIDHMVDFCTKKIKDLGSSLKCTAAVEGGQIFI